MSKSIDFSETPVTSLYGINSFSNAVMRERLPKNVYKELLEVQAGEKELSLELAEVVASAMKEPAINTMPPTVSGRAPYRSDSHPATGPAIRNPIVIGSM